MIYLIIYVVGMIITYYTIRHSFKRDLNGYNWFDMYITCVISTIWPLFWISLIKFPKEPPKWL